MWQTCLPAVSLKVKNCNFAEESMERRWVTTCPHSECHDSVFEGLSELPLKVNVGNCVIGQLFQRLKSICTLPGVTCFLASYSKFQAVCRRKPQCHATGWEHPGSLALPTALGHGSARKFGVLTVLGRGPTAWSKVAPDNLTFLFDHLGIVSTQSLWGGWLQGYCFVSLGDDAKQPGGVWTKRVFQVFKIHPLLSPTALWGATEVPSTLHLLSESSQNLIPLIIRNFLIFNLNLFMTNL